MSTQAEHRTNTVCQGRIVDHKVKELQVLTCDPRDPRISLFPTELWRENKINL